MFFTAGTTTSSNRELYVSDGTALGTFLLKDIRPTTSSASIEYFVPLGSSVYFNANDGTNGEELWVSDGSFAGTNMAFEFVTGSSSGHSSNSSYRGPVAINATQMMLSVNDTTAGHEPYISDGTAGGTTLLKNVNAPLPAESLGSTPVFITEFRGRVVFRAVHNTQGNELWVSDGTAAGTSLLKDINPGSGSSTPFDFTVVGNTLFMEANDGTNGNQLWKSDGTTVGTQLVKVINPTGNALISDTISYHGDLVFEASDGVNGTELWISDGTGAGTTMMKEIRVGSTSSATIGHMTRAGDSLFFHANDGTNGTELWKTNGNAGTTMLVKDIRAGSSSGISSSTSQRWAEMGGLLYFPANGGNGTELWVSDGTGAGTLEVANIRPLTSSSTPEDMIAIGNTLFFEANDGTGDSLWKSDGTLAGTVIVRDFRPASTSSASLNDFRNYNGMLFFGCNYNGDNTNIGNEPFLSDGTLAGTVLLKDTRPGSSSSALTTTDTSTLAVGSRFYYFTANDGTHGSELWKTDGTTLGTNLVTDLQPGSSSGIPAYHTVANGNLYFSGDDGVTGKELYKVNLDAVSQADGQGSDWLGSVPKLRIDDAVINTLINLDITDAPGSALTFYVIGARANPVTDFGLGAFFFIDTAFTLSVMVTTTPAGTHSLPLLVPNDVGLIDITVVTQGLIDNPGAPPLGMALTNAVVVTGGL